MSQHDNTYIHGESYLPYMGKRSNITTLVCSNSKLAHFTYNLKYHISRFEYFITKTILHLDRLSLNYWKKEFRKLFDRIRGNNSEQTSGWVQPIREFQPVAGGGSSGPLSERIRRLNWCMNAIESSLTLRDMNDWIPVLKMLLEYTFREDAELRIADPGRRASNRFPDLRSGAPGRSASNRSDGSTRRASNRNCSFDLIAKFEKDLGTGGRALYEYIWSNELDDYKLSIELMGRMIEICDKLEKGINFTETIEEYGRMIDSLSQVDKLPPVYPRFIEELRKQKERIENLGGLGPVFNDRLEELYCDRNLLEVMPELPANLRVLDCSNNLLTRLDVSKCVKLERLNCGGNLIAPLVPGPHGEPIGGLILTDSIQTLCISSMKIRELGVLPSSLTELDCSNNPITEIYFPTMLTRLNIRGISITKFGGIPDTLREIRMGNTELETVEIKLDNLISFTCVGCSKLREINWIGIGRKLKRLEISGTGITQLNLENFPNLRLCYIGNNQITELGDFPENLYCMYAGYNRIGRVGRINTKIKYLNLGDFQIRMEFLGEEKGKEEEWENGGSPMGITLTVRSG